jgi:diadenosine tetraphosphate (Ap4A) HIT family hydrolase
MTDMTDSTPDCKACRAIANPAIPNLVWQNERWLLRHTGAPYAELGWMTLHSRRHVPALTLLNDEELADFGPTAKRICEAIIASTGALRVYVSTLTESTPHFHAHFAPRYVGGPKGWDTILLKAKPGSRNVAEADVARVIKEVGQLLQRA